MSSQTVAVSAVYKLLAVNWNHYWTLFMICQLTEFICHTVSGGNLQRTLHRLLRLLPSDCQSCLGLTLGMSRGNTTVIQSHVYVSLANTAFAIIYVP